MASKIVRVARRLAQWKNAKNQLKKLSVLRLFQDLRLFLHDSVADDSFPILAPTCQMSRVLPPSLPAGFLAGPRESGEKYSTWESCRSAGNHE